MTDKYTVRNIIKPALKDLTQLLSKDQMNVVITGDSLAYNRYDFEPQHQENAYNCYPGILSWSFMLRDAIHQNDKWFIFGDEIDYKESKTIGGNGKGFDNSQIDYDKYSCLNHGKVATLIFNGINQTNSFLYSHSNSQTNKAVLYMQKRPDSYSCIYDIYVDDNLALLGVDNSGNTDKFKGWEPFEVDISLPGDGKAHEISFRNVRSYKNAESLVTMAGIGTKNTRIHLTGCGGKTTGFFLENLDERILEYQPDFLAFIVGANDRAYITVQEFESNLKTIMNKIKTERPNCEILLITPPSSRDLENPLVDKLPYFISDESSKPFIDAMHKVSRKYDCMFLDLVHLFNDIPIKEWRYDNVHFTKFGNTYLAKAVLDMILPNESYYRKELVDTELWAQV